MCFEPLKPFFSRARKKSSFQSADVPPKPGRGHKKKRDHGTKSRKERTNKKATTAQKNRNEGTFTKTTLNYKTALFRELPIRPNSHLLAQDAPKDQNKHVQIRTPRPSSVSSKQEQTYPNSQPLVEDTPTEDLRGANSGRFRAC